MAISDSNYSPTNRTFTGGNNLTYTPKYWEDNEVIERAEMNNLEQGIQIALEQVDTIGNTADEAVRQINSLLTQFRDDYRDFNEVMDTLSATIASDVNSNLSTNNVEIINSFKNLLGSQYVGEATSFPLSLPNGLETVDSRITQLYNAIFGNGNNNNITALQSNLSNLDTYVRGVNNTNSLTAQITAL